MDFLPKSQRNGGAITATGVLGAVDLIAAIVFGILHGVRAVNAGLEIGTVALLALSAPHLFMGHMAFAAAATALDPNFVHTLATLSGFAVLLDVIALFVRIFDPPAETDQFNLLALIGTSILVATGVALTISASSFGFALNKWRRRLIKRTRLSLGSNEKAREFWAVSKDLFEIRRILGITWFVDLILYLIFLLVFVLRLWSSEELSRVVLLTIPHSFKWVWVRVTNGPGNRGRLPEPGITRPGHLALRVTQIIVFVTLVLDAIVILIIVAALIVGPENLGFATTTIFDFGETTAIVLQSINIAICVAFLVVGAVEISQLFWMDLVLKTMSSQRRDKNDELRSVAEQVSNTGLISNKPKGA